MDDDAKDRIIRDMNVDRRGFEKELNRVLTKGNNQDGVSSKQKRQIRERMTTDTSYDGGKYKKNDRYYIEVEKDNYKRVTSDEDVYKDDSGNVWLRDSKGRFKRKLEDK